MYPPCCKQDLLDAHTHGLGEVERVMGEVNQLITSTQAQMASAQRLFQDRRGLLRSQSNR